MVLFSKRRARLTFVTFVALILVAALLDFFGSLSYYFNFEGKNIFIPYYSDRNVLPFPLLFKEFDLSNESALRSKVGRHRGSDERCSRRILREYENYRLNRDNVFENVPKQGFIAPRDSPPGWLSYTPVDKLVFNLLDAYRFDYVVKDPLLKRGSADVRNIFTNKMGTFYDLMTSAKAEHNARLYKLISSYPTLTVYAVKGIMSGDTRNVGMVSGNLNPTDLKLDHVPYQFHSNNLRLNLLGDVTAFDLAPFCFDNHITNKHKNTVNDIYNADHMVYENYKSFIEMSDVLILHLVGADHLSHCGGRNTEEMSNIMSNYNAFVRDLMEQYRDRRNYMIMFFGDHGQKESGTHGDDSTEEMETFLMVYSDLKMRSTERDFCPITETPTAYRLHHSALNGRVQPGFNYGHQHTKDICTTSALLTNVPIPFHSEGFVIPTAVPLLLNDDGSVNAELSDKYFVQLNHVNVHHLLRILDVLSQNDEVNLNPRKYRHIMEKRLRLANMYTIVRLVDTSGTGRFGPLDELYSNYVALCKHLCDLSSELIRDSTRSFTFHYLYVSIIMKYVAIVILVYCLVSTLNFYKTRKTSRTPDAVKAMGSLVASEDLRSQTPRHSKGPNWGGNDAFKLLSEVEVGRVLFRMLRSILVSLMLALALGSKVKARVPLYWFSVPVVWPLGVFERLSLLTQRYTHLLSKFFLIEEYDLYLHFTVLYATFLTLFFLYDLPLLVRSYRALLSFRCDRRAPVKLPSALSTFCHNIGLYNLRNLTLLFFCIIFFLVIVSECALYSHDTISRHLLAIFLLIETVPFLLRGSGDKYLASRVKRHLLVLLALCKLASFFHDYRLFFFSSDLPTAAWLRKQRFLSLFEVGAASLTLYYFLLLKFLRRYEKKEFTDTKDHFDFSILSSVRALRRKRLLYFVYTVSYLFVLVNYALTTQSSLLGMNNFIHNLHNAYNMKMFVSSLFAWGVLLVFVLLLVAMAANPGEYFFMRGDSYRFSSVLLFLMPSMCFLGFLISGQKKALQNLLGLLMLYHTCAILACKNSNFYLSHALLLQALADTVYFANGSTDKLNNLNFQTGFIFVNNYYGPISNSTVLFDVAWLHVLFGTVLMFTYFNSASLKYDIEGDEDGSFDLESTVRFQSFVIKSINEDDELGIISRKEYTLKKILHVIALFIFLISVLGFSILITIMKLHNIPCIALRSFPKALFLLAKATSMFFAQLALFLMRSLV